jgi:hypothetical protein
MQFHVTHGYEHRKDRGGGRAPREASRPRRAAPGWDSGGYRPRRAPRLLLQDLCAGLRLVSTHWLPSTAGTVWSTVSAPGLPQMWQMVERTRTRRRLRRWRDPRPRLLGDFGGWCAGQRPRYVAVRGHPTSQQTVRA